MNNTLSSESIFNCTDISSKTYNEEIINHKIKLCLYILTILIIYHFSILRKIKNKIVGEKMNKSGLIYNIYSGIIEANKVYEYLFIISLILIRAGIFTTITSINFTIMKYVKENNKPEMLKWIMIITFCKCVSSMVQYYQSYRFMNILDIDIREYYTKKYYNKLFYKSNYEWLKCNNPEEINTAIQDGIYALISSIIFIMNLLLPIIESIGCIYIISTYTGYKIIVILFVMSSIFFTGVKLTEWEYTHQKEINKITNPLDTFNKHLSDNIFPARLNNQGKKNINIISENSLKDHKLNIEVSNYAYKMIHLLEIIGLFMVYIIIYYISLTENSDILFTININLYMVYDRMWNLFYMFNNASETAARWATLEEYLKKVVYEEPHLKKDLIKYTLVDKNGKNLPEHNEYRICGDSGVGKSTWMSSHIIKLCRNYNHCWMYLDQDMTIPTSSCITIRKYLHDYLKDTSVKIDNIILKWAKYLHITSIINKDTLDKSFKSPSGGEKKRINILRMLLPIFTKQSTIKLLFLDEITSGLDDKTHDIVRKLIDKLKSKFKIIIINIDHHTINTSCCEIEIIKTSDGNCPYKERVIEVDKTHTRIMNYFQFLDFSNKYKIKDEQDTLSFPPVIEINSSKISDKLNI